MMVGAEGLLHSVQLVDLVNCLAAFNLDLIEVGDGYQIENLVVGALRDQYLAAFGQFLQAL